MDQPDSPLTALNLHRLPRAQELRAWDAADELILNYLTEQNTPLEDARVLLVNDNFGALACSLADRTLSSWSDSRISHIATEENLKSNHLNPVIEYIPSTESPNGSFDLILIKVPKTLALLEHQLITLKANINDDSLIIAGGMVKYLQKSQQQLFEKIIGNTTTSLAVKKARLIFANPALTQNLTQSPYPQHSYNDEIDLHISHHANVFSRDKLDIGTRFMLQQFEQLPEAKSIVDLGCGNGILGIIAKRQQTESEVYFIDESYMAVDSAKENYFNPLNLDSQKETDRDHFIAANCLEQTALNDVDLILCNPPFHQSNTVGDQIAWQMLKQSHKALKKGGHLWVVGNRHLSYHVKLKRLFGNCKTIATNKKFVVLETVKA